MKRYQNLLSFLLIVRFPHFSASSIHTNSKGGEKRNLTEVRAKIQLLPKHWRKLKKQNKTKKLKHWREPEYF